jgi:hypothetical protein
MCQAGASQNACGLSGNGCVVCNVGTNCEFGRCVTASTGGGSGGGTGGGTGGGAMGGGTGGGATGGGTGGGATGGGTGGGTTGGGTGGGATGGGTGGGATGGGTGGGDAGMPMFDAGTVTRPDGGTLNPQTFAITFAQDCGNVTLCSGNEVDAWAYTAGCIDDAAFTPVTNAAQQFGCSATVSNKNGALAGSVVFDGTMVHRSARGEVNYTLTATGSTCVQGCAFFGPQLASYGLRGSCASNGTACVCDLTFDIAQSGSYSYTYNGGQLTVMGATSDGGSETYESCITGSNLTYRETTQGGIPGVFTLTK